MSRRRFIADQVCGGRAVVEGGRAEHLSRVLRARPGQEFEVAAGGRVRLGRIVQVEQRRVEFELGAEVAVKVLAPVTLYLAVFKFDRMEWALEKCTELGAERIVPLICSRTGAGLAAAAEKRAARWRRLMAQAAEQSRRAAPPELADPLRLNHETLAARGSAGARVVLAESECALRLRDALDECRAQAGDGSFPVALATGPEGGWTGAERELFAQCGWTSASLGPTILRAETAAIAALAIVQNL
jgi:16S rRNA (uracil1498-N3)-methyltransferase